MVILLHVVFETTLSICEYYTFYSENARGKCKIKKGLAICQPSDCRQSPAFAGFCYCWNRFSDIINIRRAVFFYDDEKYR